MNARPDEPIPALSPRLLEIAEMIGRGLPNPAIARALGISEVTVKGYVVEIALRLPNPDHLRARDRIFLWVQRRKWEAELVERRGVA